MPVTQKEETKPIGGGEILEQVPHSTTKLRPYPLSEVQSSSQEKVSKLCIRRCGHERHGSVSSKPYPCDIHPSCTKTSVLFQTLYLSSPNVNCEFFVTEKRIKYPSKDVS